MSDIDRHSRAETAEVVKDKAAVAKQEAANAVLQAQRVRDYILDALDGKPFKLRPSTLLDLNRCAIQGLDAYAGNWRPAGIEIGESKHVPPDGHLVAELVEELCDYVNDNWAARSAVHSSAFVMWRLNWIHPFTDGNGRTSRATSYLVLCVHSNMLFPGEMSISEQIVANKGPYYDALEDADARYVVGEPFREDVVEAMENLVGAALAVQAHHAFEGATAR